jgi:hypothetical protein
MPVESVVGYVALPLREPSPIWRLVHLFKRGSLLFVPEEVVGYVSPELIGRIHALLVEINERLYVGTILRKHHG